MIWNHPRDKTAIELLNGCVTLITTILWAAFTPDPHAPDGVLLVTGLLLLSGGVTVIAISRFVRGLLVPFGAGMLGWGGLSAILLSARENESRRRILCEDDGAGIPQEDKNRISDKDFRKNTRYGLFLAREILDMTGLRIPETGIPGKGARIEILVPPGRYRRDVVPA